MHTESQHICLVGTEITKVRLSTSAKILNRKTKIYPFLITNKVEHIRQKKNLSLVSREMGCDMNGTYYYY